MKGTGSVIPALVIILLAASIIMAGCTVPAGQQKSRLQTIAPEDEGAPVETPLSLQDAMEALRSPDAGGMMRAPAYSIHYVHGEGIDTSGRAENWIIAVKTDDSQLYFQYGSDGSGRKYNWTEQDPGPALAMDRILMPEGVIAVHRSLFQDILSGPGITRSELELSGGIYTFTVNKGGAVWEYAFNAETGGLVENRRF